VTALLSFLFFVVPNPPWVRDVQARWGPTMQAEVVTVACGQMNAYYFKSDDLVVMCQELYVDLDLSAWVLNHELGHAFMDHYDVPGSERGADELAFLMSTQPENLAAARWFMRLGHPSNGHPASMERAASLICLNDGREEPGVDRACTAYASSVEEHWLRILQMVRPDR